MKAKDLYPYLPARIAETIFTAGKEKPAFHRIENLKGSVLWVDLTNFSSVASSLQNDHSRGSELLQEILNKYFALINTRILENGGGIYQFAGDSVLASFEKNVSESEADCAARTASCATSILEQIHSIRYHNFGSQEFDISARVSCTFGEYNQILLGDIHSKMSVAIIGEPVSELLDGGSLADGESVFISKKMYGLLNTSDKANEVNGSYASFVSLNTGFISSPQISISPASSVLPDEISPGELKVCSHFILDSTLKNIKAGRKDLPGDFRDVTIVFLRLPGFQLQDEHRSHVKNLNELYLQIVKLADDYGGAFLQTDLSDKGSVFLISFGAPYASENREKLAASFALRCQRIIKEQNFNFGAIGIATGPCFAGDIGSSDRKGYTVIGDTVNLAARLMSLEDNSTIWCDARTRNKICAEFELADCGEVSLKGMSSSKHAYEIKGEKSAAPQNITDGVFSQLFVGRDAELAKLQECLSKAQNSEPTLVHLVGEAGVGKTRLISHFIENISKEKEATQLLLLSSVCYSYEKNSPYFAFRSILQQVFDINSDQDDKEKLSRIQEKMNHLTDESEDWINVIASLTGVSVNESDFIASLEPRQKNDRILQIVTTLLSALTEKSLVILRLDDIHWIDSNSLNLLHYIADNLPKARLLLLLISRPQASFRLFADQPGLIEIQLAELNEANAKRLLDNLLNLDETTEEANLNLTIKKLILERSHGNPYFIESQVHNMRERGQLVQQDSDKSSFAGTLDDFQVPETLQDVVLSRIDRLGANEQMVLKTASVVGKTFMYSQLRKLLQNKMSSDIKDYCNTLEQLELTPILTNEPLTYIFKQLIIRDVAYNSLLRSTQKNLHNEIGTLIDNDSTIPSDEKIDLLAWHYMAGENYEKALEYSILLGRKAYKQYANTDSIQFFTQALDILQRPEFSSHAETTYDVKEELAIAYRNIGNINKARELLLECLDWHKSSVRRARIYVHLGQISQAAADNLDAIEHLENGLAELGQKVPKTRPGVILALLGQLLVQTFHSKFPSLIRKVKKESKQETYALRARIFFLLGKIYFFKNVESVALAVYYSTNLAERTGHPEELTMAYSNYALVTHSMGFKKIPEIYFNKSLELAKDLNNPLINMINLQRYSMKGLFQNDMELAVKMSERAVKAGEKSGDFWEVSITYLFMAISKAIAGNLKGSISALESMQKFARLSDSKTQLGWAIARKAYYEYIINARSLDDVLADIEEGINIASKEDDFAGLSTALAFKAAIYFNEKEIEKGFALTQEVYDNLLAFKMDLPHMGYNIFPCIDLCLKVAVDESFSEKDRKAADKLLAKSLKYLKRISKLFPYLHGPYLKYQALHARALNKTEKSRTLIEKSINYLKSTDNPIEYALALKVGVELLEDGEYLNEANNIIEKYNLKAYLIS